MKLGYPSILCAVERTLHDQVSEILSEYNLNFIDNEFDVIDQAHDPRFEVILISCDSVEGKAALTCRIIRLNNEVTPVLLISGSSELSDTQASVIGAQAVIHSISPTFADDLKRAVKEALYRAI
jgi:hypothetical protein